MAKSVLFLLIALMLNGIVLGQRYAAPASHGEQVGCYISNGDNDLLYFSPPIDSKNTIDGLYDLLKNVYGVDRIYWRAAQVHEIMYHCQSRPEHFHHADLWKWVGSLYKNYGLDRYGVDAAHARGMTVWGIAALFDHGGHAVVDSGKGYGPSPVESFIRLQHPEWIPVDRFGIRKMSGPICFAYPQARKALINMQLKLATSADYDGLMFHTYVEQMATRYDDEFGFNEPIVSEFKKRYGLDIRTESYDKEALADLRGEYLTQYFRELKAALKTHNIKLGIFLSPTELNKPQRWLADTSIMCSGNITIDWQRYIDEGIMDEIMVYCGGDVYSVIDQVLSQAKGTDCKVSMFHSAGYPEEKKYLAEQGVMRAIDGSSRGFEYGYFEDQPISALDSDDFIARLSVIQQMSDGRTEADLQKIIAATKDKHVMVRRRAVVTLATINASGPIVIAALEDALEDPENAVRCFAINTLAKIPALSSASVDKIYNCLDKHNNAMMNIAAQGGLAALIAKQDKDLIRGLKHKNSEVRYVVVNALAGVNISPELFDALFKLSNDPSEKVRWAVAKAFGKLLVPTTESNHGLYNFLKDSHPTVHGMAALKLSTLIQTHKDFPLELRKKVLLRLQQRFSDYNNSYSKSDKDWGWRCLGDALNRLAPQGPEFLQNQLSQTEDMVLAEHAWEMLYVKEVPDWKFPLTPQDQAEAAYSKHPRLRDLIIKKVKD